MLHSNSFNNTQNKINALTRQVDACKQRRACAHTHAYTRTNSHTHSQAITYMHTSTRANTHVCARAQTYTATIYTLSHTCVCAHRNTHTYTHTHTNTCTHTCIHAHLDARAGRFGRICTGATKLCVLDFSFACQVCLWKGRRRGNLGSDWKRRLWRCKWPV